MKKLNLLIVLFAFYQLVFGQQEPELPFLDRQLSLVNPAASGSHENIQGQLAFRQQWAGIKDAPQTQAASVSIPSNVKSKVGLNIINDQVFVERNTQLSLDYNYALEMVDKSILYLGVDVMGRFYNIDGGNLRSTESEIDPNIISENSFRFNFGGGAYYKRENWYIAASVPAILKQNKLSDADHTPVSVPHFYISGGSSFEVSDEVKIRPSILLRAVPNGPTSVRANVYFGYEAFEIGLHGQTEGLWSISAFYELNSQFTFGYSFESTTHSTINELGGTSHQVLVGYKMEEKKKKTKSFRR